MSDDDAPIRGTLHRRYRLRRTPAATPHGYAYTVGLPVEVGAMLAKRGFSHVTYTFTDKGILVVPRKPESDHTIAPAAKQVEAMLDTLETGGPDDDDSWEV